MGFSILISRLLLPKPIRKRTTHAAQEKQNKAFQNVCVQKLLRGLVYSYRRHPREEPLASTKLQISVYWDFCVALAIRNKYLPAKTTQMTPKLWALPTSFSSYTRAHTHIHTHIYKITACRQLGNISQSYELHY